MDAMNFKEKDLVLGQPREWDEQKDGKVFGLPIRYALEENPRMIYSYWRPSEHDIALLLAGGYVRLGICGDVHPPVSVVVRPDNEITVIGVAGTL